MPSRVEKNYSKSRSNKRTERNQRLYDSTNGLDYEIISDTKSLFNDVVDLVEEKEELPSILKTEKLTSLIDEVEKERDINKILKEAKSNRSREDELEKKRKLDKKEYNITKKINVDDEEAVNRFRNQNKKTVENEEELSELINTIYSKKTSDNLLGDLMPSSKDEAAVSDDDNVIEDIEEEKKKIENSFFTSSIELSEDDLEEIKDDDEEEIFFDDDKVPVMKIIFTVVGVIIFIAILGFVIYEYFLKV